MDFCGQETNASPWTSLSQRSCPLFNSSLNIFPSHTCSRGFPSSETPVPHGLERVLQCHTARVLTPTIILLITSSLLPRASHDALSKLPVISRLTLQLLAVWGKDCHFIICTAQPRAQCILVGCLWVLLYYI